MISTKEAAQKLGVSERRVRMLCAAGRVKGAKLVGGTWVLPDDVAIAPGGRERPGKVKLARPKK